MVQEYFPGLSPQDAEMLEGFLADLGADLHFATLVSEYFGLASFKELGKSNLHYRRARLEKISDEIFIIGIKAIEKKVEKLPKREWEDKFKVLVAQLYALTAVLNRVRLAHDGRMKARAQNGTLCQRVA